MPHTGKKEHAHALKDRLYRQIHFGKDKNKPKFKAKLTNGALI